jgi:tRNA dimethylallyltransferase
LSLDLAEALADRGAPAEVVNADAMQLYRGMDIGTAKLPEAERRGIPHHLFDILEIEDEASVAAYQGRARLVVDDILARGATPILVGGSGLYVSSVLWDFTFPGTDPAIRAALEAELASHGPGMLFRRLDGLDPVAAASIGPSNGRRIVRALEVIELTGEPFGAGLPEAETPWRPTTIIGLRTERAQLVARLDERVERMWRDGLVDEVASLGPERMGVTAARAIGYAQAIAELDGTMTEGDAIAQTAALTRKYARRQVGWFRRYPTDRWIDSDDANRVSIALATIDQ